VHFPRESLEVFFRDLMDLELVSIATGLLGGIG
jgi:hypothetical protein